MAYGCFPLALLIALAAFVAGMETGSVWTFEATLLCSAIVLGSGLLAHAVATFLDPKDPMDGGGDTWGNDDDLATSSTRAIDTFYWVLSWPLMPFAIVAMLVRERVTARTAARQVIQRARRRSWRSPTGRVSH